MADRSGIMLCYPFEESRLAKWEPPWLVQPKLDGERCRAVFSLTHGGWVLISSQQHIIVGVPHINKALRSLGIPTDLELDGELFIKGAPFEDIHSIVSRTVNISPDYERVQYWIFDIVDESKPQIRRSAYLRELALSFIEPIIYVPTFQVETLDSLLRHYENFLRAAYEGIIVRHTDALYYRKRSIYMMKFKPKKTDTYTIVGYKEEEDKNGQLKNSLGALLLAGDDGSTFSVGSGLTWLDRQELWKARDTLPGKLCEVAYQHLTSAGRVPRFPVFLKIIDVNSCSIEEVSPI